MQFVHLRLKTQYSLLNSVLSVDKVLAHAKSDGAKAVVMMDDSNLCGVFEFSSKVSGAGIKPIIGLNLATESAPDVKRMNDAGGNCVLPFVGLIAQSQKGYRNLVKIVNKSQFGYAGSHIEQKYVTIEDLAEFAEDVICLTGGIRGVVGKALIAGCPDAAEAKLNKLHEIFGDRLYIELTRHGRDKEKMAEDWFVEKALEKNIPLVATNDVHFLTPSQRRAHDVVRCISAGVYEVDKDRERFNAEYYLKSQDQMVELFSDIPEAIENTVNIAKRCSFFLEKRSPSLPSFIKAEEDEVAGMTEEESAQFVLEKEKAEIWRVSESGLSKRLEIANITEPEKVKVYTDRLKVELDIITKIGFAGYFLIVSDFIRWAKENGIPVGPGRGSGAGSIVAWSMQITNVDPIHYGLLFERFLNPERVSMPDFDIDFCPARRGEVIEYVREKYGHERVASIITFGTLQPKAVLKDVGRVLQLPYMAVDNICKLIPFNPAEPVTLKKAIEMDDSLRSQAAFDEDIQTLLEISLELEGAYRHSSTHAAGVVISDQPIYMFAPTHKDENDGIPILSLNMKDAEKVGFVKFDFLGLKNLTIISETCKLIKETKGVDINIDIIPTDDAPTFELLRSSKTKGIFQLEAAVPREALKKSGADCIEDITAITSLNRPGPMENMPSYINRKNGQEKVDYMHPILKPLLEETYGIIIYQEQVMRAAQIMSGYSLGSADILRRAMGKKIKEEMDKQRLVFEEGAAKNDIAKKTASDIFDKIEKFAGYGFNKSHAVAYSVISYQTAFLKTHYMIEFFVSMLNLDMHNTDRLNEVVSEIKEYGIEIVLPDVNVSQAKFVPTKDGKIMYSFAALKAIGLEAISKICDIRKEKGAFKDIMDFAEKCGKLANKKIIESLAKSGAFNKLHENQKQLLMEENVKKVIAYGQSQDKKDDSMDSLFGDAEVSYRPKLAPCTEKTTNAEKLAYEFESVGFYISQHPLEEYKEKIESCSVQSDELEILLEDGKKREFYMSGVVTKVKQRFSSRGRFAFLNLADLKTTFETMIFNDDLINESRDLMVEGSSIVLLISGKKDDTSGFRLNVKEIHGAKTFFTNNTLVKTAAGFKINAYDPNFTPKQEYGFNKGSSGGSGGFGGGGGKLSGKKKDLADPPLVSAPKTAKTAKKPAMRISTTVDIESEDAKPFVIIKCFAAADARVAAETCKNATISDAGDASLVVLFNGKKHVAIRGVNAGDAAKIVGVVRSLIDCVIVDEFNYIN